MFDTRRERVNRYWINPTYPKGYEILDKQSSKAVVSGIETMTGAIRKAQELERQDRPSVVEKR